YMLMYQEGEIKAHLQISQRCLVTEGATALNKYFLRSGIYPSVDEVGDVLLKQGFPSEVGCGSRWGSDKLEKLTVIAESFNYEVSEDRLSGRVKSRGLEPSLMYSFSKGQLTLD
uniref:hypothetical protein n=1 Tax=Marinagarivorans algicola TaxID=1513270 RepID=UPI001C10263E